MRGPSSARQRNAFRWRAGDGPTLNAGSVGGPGPVLLRNAVFCDVSGGVRTPCPPSGFAHDNMAPKAHLFILFICLLIYLFKNNYFETFVGRLGLIPATHLK